VRLGEFPFCGNDSHQGAQLAPSAFFLFFRKTDPTSNLLGALKVSQLFTHRVSPIRQSSASAAVPSKTTAGTIGYPIGDGGAGRRQHHPQGC